MHLARAAGFVDGPKVVALVADEDAVITDEEAPLVRVLAAGALGQPAFAVQSRNVVERAERVGVPLGVVAVDEADDGPPAMLPLATGGGVARLESADIARDFDTADGCVYRRKGASRDGRRKPAQGELTRLPIGPFEH